MFVLKEQSVMEFLMSHFKAANESLKKQGN